MFSLESKLATVVAMRGCCGGGVVSLKSRTWVYFLFFFMESLLRGEFVMVKEGDGERDGQLIEVVLCTAGMVVNP